MPPKSLLPRKSFPEDQLLRLAELHYVTEQNVRAWHVWSGDIDPAALSFDRSWPQIHTHLRDVYIERVKHILYSDLDSYTYVDEDKEGHPRFFRSVYTAYYEKMDAEVIRKEVVMPSTTFKELFASHINRVKVATPLIPLRPQKRLDGTDKNVLFTRNFQPGRSPQTPIGIPNGNGQATVQQATAQTHEEPQPESVTRLETAMTKGVQALDHLHHLFMKDTNWKASSETDWPAEITRIKTYAEPVKVIIGIVGSTGAGKSSLINAVVDEENILATNCMRASTAVATEVAYNHHSSSKYRAEVEFISRGEWERELDALVRDMNGHSEEVLLQQDENVFRHSEAAVAVDKIRAVYPMLSAEEIMDSSVEGLMEREMVGELLGETVVIESEDQKVFAKELATYTDSKGKKRTPNNNKNGKGNGDVKGKAPMRTVFDNQSTTIGYWPLVRVVRIYVKAKALSTGATLVDLPGVFDSNAARVAVAQEYMKKCSAYWVVTPINRAIDDKVAHDLLNQNLRFQLHMDGAFNDLTFVCTKTDDISVSEVQESLLRRDLPSPSLGDERQLKCKDLEQDVHILDAKLLQIVSEIVDIDDRIEQLLSCEKDSAGDDAHGGSPSKRKRDSLGSAQRPVEESDLDSDSEFQLKNEEIRALNDQRRELYHQRRYTLNELTSKKVRKANLEAEIEDQKINLVHECIKARNEYSKQELKRDFAHGIHDFCYQGLLDMIGSGVQQSNPEQELPVFCVSTRAYQKLRGRLRKEASVYGFTKLEETEVPQLQGHCIEITNQTREASALRFLLHLRQLLNSISLWASGVGGVQTSEQNKIDIESRFQGSIEKFKKEVNVACEGFMQGMCDILTINIIRHFDDASSKASIECPELVEKWKDLRFNTYQAICRRGGAFGDHNWNQDLANLLIKPLMNGWKNAFEVEMPMELDWFAESMKDYLRAFHVQAITSAGGVLSDMDVDILQDTWMAQYETMEREVKLITRVVRKMQREINREFAVVMEEQLKPIYERCASESGPRTLGRMRDHMKTHTVTTSPVIFDHSTSRVKTELIKLLDLIENVLTAVAKKVTEQTSRDYMTCILTPLVQQFSSSQLRVKKEVAEATHTAERELELEDLLDDAQFGSYGDCFYQENHGALAWGGIQPQKRVLESIKEEDEEEI